MRCDMFAEVRERLRGIFCFNRDVLSCKLLFFKTWLQAAFPLSLVNPMAADGYNPVSLRQKSKKKSRGNVTMSRRRVSVKELGQTDHQGWLYRKKEGKGFLGIKWKKYWFVLKRTSLYWYTSQMAEKAEGYINLTDFVIDRATECKKKYAMKACHPQVMMFYFAAETSQDMNKWLNKLGLASIQNEPAENTAECYSEASDHEEASLLEVAPPPYTEQPTTDSGSLPPPYSSPTHSEASGSTSTPVSTITSQSSTSSMAKNRQSWMDMVSQASTVAGETVVCSVQVHSCPPPDSSVGASNPPQLSKYPPEDTNSGDLQVEPELSPQSGCIGEEPASDEMEKLYIHLKQASLSPIGDRKPSTKREFRKSFFRRCKNQNINEKLHLIRTLNSTLKAKEADLHTIEQILTEPSLTAVKYREWKEANLPLLQDICHREDRAPESPEEARRETGKTAPCTETSL